MKAKTTGILRSVNPATLEVIGEVEATAPVRVAAIVEETRRAFPAWREMGFRRRAAILKRAQQLLIERAEDFAKNITLEMGRPINESYAIELSASIDLIGYYADRAGRFLRDRKVPLHHLLFLRRRSRVYFEPLGVLGIIAPWNWPLLIPLGCIVPALLSGNTLVFKHSELTPLIAVRIRNLFLDAGVPEDAFRIIQGGPDQGRALVDSSVRKIFFTGSTEVGRMIYGQASGSLKDCVLEMGGSDPAIVCEDADLEITSSGLVWGGFSNCGQNCNAVERIYVHERVADRLISLLTERLGSLRIEDGLAPDTDMGPLASEGQLLKTDSIVQMAKELGAKLISGGRGIDRLSGYFYEPTLIGWDKAVPQPKNIEIFGPIVTITAVKNDEEAVRLANHSDFGLAASIWTTDARHGEALARRVEAGTVMINDSIVSFGMTEAGWTGIKDSGIGWVHGEKGLDEMINIKYVNRDPMAHTQNFWWFPYSEKMMTTMRAGIDFLFSSSVTNRLKSVLRASRDFLSYLVVNRRKKDKL